MNEMNRWNPFLSPAWRWRHCQALAEAGLPGSNRKLGDDWIDECLKFALALRQCDDEAKRQHLAVRFPALTEAHDLFISTEPLRKAELEARLLAGETNEAIAAKMNLSPSGVEAFHAVYFEVRPNLHAHGYILTVVLDPRIHYGLTPDDTALILKLFAYQRGPEIIDGLLRYFANPVSSLPERLDQLGEAELEELHLMLLIRGVILLMTTPLKGQATESFLSTLPLLYQASQPPQKRPDVTELLRDIPCMFNVCLFLEGLARMAA